jgi:hypothetical protein
MIKIILTISLSIFSLASAAHSAGEKYTPYQKKEIAQFMGIILVGFSKQDVRDTFSFTEPDIWYTDSGQEVWYYPTPEAQNIYFQDDKVEEVEYTLKKHRNDSPTSKKKIDL